MLKPAAALFSLLSIVAGQPAVVWGPPAPREPKRVRTWQQIPAVKAFPDWKPNSRQIRRAKERAAAKAAARQARAQQVAFARMGARVELDTNRTGGK